MAFCEKQRFFSTSSVSSELIPIKCTGESKEGVDLLWCCWCEWRLTCLSPICSLTETTYSGKVWEAEGAPSPASRSLALTRSQEPIYTEDLMVSLLFSGSVCFWSHEWCELSSCSILHFV